jgi:hypothetical protein
MPGGGMTESGKPVASAVGVKADGTDGTASKFAVESGHYEFASRLN